jgi:hypothetical protein
MGHSIAYRAESLQSVTVCYTANHKMALLKNLRRYMCVPAAITEGGRRRVLLARRRAAGSRSSVPGAQSSIPSEPLLYDTPKWLLNTRSTLLLSCLLCYSDALCVRFQKPCRSMLPPHFDAGSLNAKGLVEQLPIRQG